jgi:hypothetical protein
MTPDPIILLSPDNRLDALLYALEASRTHWKAKGGMHAPYINRMPTIESWEALHAELMAQLSPKDSIKCSDKEEV